MAKVPVYDQGSLGSCTSNMGCTMFRYLCAKNGLPPLDVSRMSLYKATRTIEGTPLTEDSGAQIRNVMVALRKFGVALEESDPYVDDGHAFTVPVTEQEAADAAKHVAVYYYRLLGLHTLKACIAQGYPFGAGFTVYETLMSDDAARTGLVPMPVGGDAPQGGHAITFFAFDDQKKVGSSTGAFLFRNSWSASWGDAGDGWLGYDYITSGLASDFWTLRDAVL